MNKIGKSFEFSSNLTKSQDFILGKIYKAQVVSKGKDFFIIKTNNTLFRINSIPLSHDTFYLKVLKTNDTMVFELVGKNGVVYLGNTNIMPINSGLSAELASTFEKTSKLFSALLSFNEDIAFPPHSFIVDNQSFYTAGKIKDGNVTVLLTMEKKAPVFSLTISFDNGKSVQCKGYIKRREKKVYVSFRTNSLLLYGKIKENVNRLYEMGLDYKWHVTCKHEDIAE